MRTQQAIAALGALAHEHRLAVYRLLVEQGPEGLSAGAIAGRVGMLPSSLSFHVRTLQRAGLITQRRVSRQLFYAARFDAMNALIGYLMQNCCGQAAKSCPPICQPAGAVARPTRSRKAA